MIRRAQLGPQAWGLVPEKRRFTEMKSGMDWEKWKTGQA